MENAVENINIEKSKALFAYEMTEVILKLKGEFAAFSGKGTRFAQMAVDDSKLQVSVPDAVQVKTEKIALQAPSVTPFRQIKPAPAVCRPPVQKLPVFTQSVPQPSKPEVCPVKTVPEVRLRLALPAASASRVKPFAIPSPKSAFREKEAQIISSVAVPAVASIREGSLHLRKKTHTERIGLRLPPAAFSRVGAYASVSSVRQPQIRIEKGLSACRPDAKAMTARLQTLSLAGAFGTAGIRAPKVCRLAPVSITERKAAETGAIKVPKCSFSADRLPPPSIVACTPVSVDMPFVPLLKPIRLKAFGKEP